MDGDWSVQGYSLTKYLSIHTERDINKLLVHEQAGFGCCSCCLSYSELILMLTLALR